MEEAQKRTLDGDSQNEPPAKREKIEKNQENTTNAAEDTQDKSKRLPRPSKKDKNGRSAGRRRGTRPEGESQQGEGDNKDKKPRLAKRSCALMIGFSGTGYYGMQV
jgi:tRNA pseudouridine38-40 synthase